MSARRKRGDETSARLRDWTDSQKAAERLAAHVLSAEGFVSIDPTHPLGGPDGLKDLVCERDGFRWVGAVHFPNGDKPFPEVQKKFLADAQGPPRHDADGFVFVTNQYLTESQRAALVHAADDLRVEVYHRERIVGVLDRPANYGVRLEYLDIEMDKTEQLAFFSTVSAQMAGIHAGVSTLIGQVRGKELDDDALAVTVSRLESALAPLRGTGVLYGMATPLDRIGVLLTRLDRDPWLKRLLGGHTDITSTGMFTPPLERIEAVLNRLDQLDPGLKQLLGGRSDFALTVTTTPLDRLERVMAELGRLLDRGDSLARTISESEGPQRPPDAT